MALRTLEERVELSRHMAERFRTRGIENMATRFHHQADEAEARARIVRETLLVRG
jgi:hypothetical protein